MSAALEHPIGPTTVADWLAQEHPSDGSRLELIWGYLHVTPPRTGQHQSATFKLARIIEDALTDNARLDLHVVPGVGIKISTAWRTGLIPDIAVLNTRPVGASFEAEHLVLVVEIWSPGNSRSDRESKTAGYAGAGVPYFWTLNQDRAGAPSLTTYRLENGRYIQELTAGPGSKVTVTAAPVPVTFDPADLLP